MEKVPLKIKILSHFKGDLPSYQTELASGFDVRAQLESPLTLKSLERALVPTGLAFDITAGYEIQARPRSGLAAKHGLTLANAPGTIDADYKGEVKIILINLSTEDVTINSQDRIAQLVLCPVVQAQFETVNQLTESQRGEGGFGSTGKN